MTRAQDLSLASLDGAQMLSKVVMPLLSPTASHQITASSTFALTSA